MLTYVGWVGVPCALLQFRYRVGSAALLLCDLSHGVALWEKPSGSEKSYISGLRIWASQIKFGDKHGNCSFLHHWV